MTTPVRPRRIVGDLSDTKGVLDFLGIEVEEGYGMTEQDSTSPPCWSESKLASMRLTSW